MRGERSEGPCGRFALVQRSMLRLCSADCNADQVRMARILSAPIHHEKGASG
jgi:hypothetical protein